MTKRSIFLKNENLSDVQSALAKAPDRKQEIWRRMKLNGCDKESETRFREHCHTISFVLPDETGKANPMAKNPSAGANARLLAESIRHEMHIGKTQDDMEDQ